MKKRWTICFILFVIVVILTTVLVVKINGYNHTLGKYEQEEIVIDNKISLKAKEIHDYMKEHNYGYCTYDYRCEHEGECGLNSTFELSKTNRPNTCCATYVSWVFQESVFINCSSSMYN